MTLARLQQALMLAWLAALGSALGWHLSRGDLLGALLWSLGLLTAHAGWLLLTFGLMRWHNRRHRPVAASGGPRGGPKSGPRRGCSAGSSHSAPRPNLITCRRQGRVAASASCWSTVLSATVACGIPGCAGSGVAACRSWQ